MSGDPRRTERQRRSGSTVKTLATTAALAYGAYKTYEYFNNETDNSVWDGISQWMSSLILEEEGTSASSAAATRSRGRHSKRLDARTRHKQSLQSIRKCRQEVIKAYSTCWPALQHVIDTKTDTAKRTKELRELRKGDATVESKVRQNALWKEIQLETLTRLVSTEYACSLLLLSLTMQLHWIGGQLFQRKYGMHESSPAATMTDDSRWAQEVMMESHQYMASQGIPLLITAVRRALSVSSMQDWTATTFVSRNELHDLLLHIDQYLERGGGGSTYTRNWIRLVLPDPTLGDDSDDNDEDCDDADMRRDCGDAKLLMLESIWDLAESPAWQDAQVQTLETVRKQVCGMGWGRIYGGDSPRNVQAPEAVPLAKLMAPFKTACSIVSLSGSTEVEKGKRAKNKNSAVHKLQKLPAVMELGEISFKAIAL